MPGTAPRLSSVSVPRKGFSLHSRESLKAGITCENEVSTINLLSSHLSSAKSVLQHLK